MQTAAAPKRSPDRPSFFLMVENVAGEDVHLVQAAPLDDLLGVKDPLDAADEDDDEQEAEEDRQGRNGMMGDADGRPEQGDEEPDVEEEQALEALPDRRPV